MRVRDPSNEPEARAVLEDHIAELRGRGYDALTKLIGTVRGRYLFGRITLYEGPGGELSEATAPSGALYHLATYVTWADDEGGDVSVEVKLQEDADPGGSLSTEFNLSRDGTVEVQY